MATELKRNIKTGIVEAWRDGKYIGEIITMGDIIEEDNSYASEEYDEPEPFPEK